jgi:chromosome segregation protein
MYLEKLEIQGFKSFANKNTLLFPGLIDKKKRGITAIVGPNGSGKSNVADSVRWALGEQSLKTLRGKKSDDVIFSGSDKKGRLGLAEVSLFLNNEDKSLWPKGSAANNEGTESNIDLLLKQPQIIITRRIFRDGESEYLINNNRVRLTDTQILLAKANFGQKTYSVIGQGMVEGFLNTSLAERKDFFDEATGVKQYQIKRDLALNKLQSSYENLNQVEMLLNEIEPRLRSLTRQVHRLEKRSLVEGELQELQLQYYRQVWHNGNDKFNDYNQQFIELEKNKTQKNEKLINLNKELSEKSLDDSVTQEYNELQKTLTTRQQERDSLVKEVNKIEARLEMKLESTGQFDLSFLNNRQTELNSDIARLSEEVNNLNSELGHDDLQVKQLLLEKNSLTEKISKLNGELLQASAQSGEQDLAKINKQLERSIEKLIAAEATEDLAIIKTALAEIRQELQTVLELASGQNNQAALERIQADLARFTNDKEEILEKINAINLAKAQATERQKLLNEQIGRLQTELQTVQKKISQNQEKFDAVSHQAERADLDGQINKINAEIKTIRERIDAFNQSRAAERGYLFELQKNIQALQWEINELSNESNDLKINATRYETRLEDLENEIRQNNLSLKDIKDTRSNEEVLEEVAQDKINQLKKQLELIGGIDPEVTKEYEGTKERYDFLFNQTEDLNSAIKSLEKIIYELDMVIKERFDDEFKIISEKFTEYFKILFNGGNAKIVKVMASDEEMNKDKKVADKNEAELVEKEKEVALNKEQIEYNNLNRLKFLRKHNATGLAGIEIEATPPGKKIKSISMLSGGERALTAIALICAIISANPSPFVVLDEVDAALDEANSERLAQILDDLSNKTQFIVVTHNRASMRKASILYGITMQADGISQLLSVKLDDVKVNQ